MQISLYNTLNKSVQPFTTADGSNTVRVYSCGPTVYNSAHIGNLRAFLAADLVQRVLRVVGGFEIQWVMNVTDVDDKTIRDSAPEANAWKTQMGDRSGDPVVDLRTFTTYWADQFLIDIDAIGIDHDHLMELPRATDYIDQMAELIGNIVEAGYAYERDGSVYFDVAKYRTSHEYGRLFAIDFEHFQAGVRIDADEYERESVSDFVLWKKQKDDEPYWDLELDGKPLPGRPGWHLECSVMSKALLGPLPFDVHTGGVDLRFPHHEDELAQCCAGYGASEQAMFWVHNEFLNVEGEKMSKSLNNFYTLNDIEKKGIEPLDLRFAMLSTHYRSVYNFSFDSVKAASLGRAKIQDYIWDLVDYTGGFEHVAEDGPRELAEAFEALASDAHTPKALAAIHAFINSNPVIEISEQRAASILFEFGMLNGVFNVWTAAPRPTIEIPKEIEDLADTRWIARSAKNWAEADRLRDQLRAKGWEMKDGKDSYELHQL